MDKKTLRKEYLKGYKAGYSLGRKSRQLTKREKQIINDALSKGFSLNKNYETIIKKLSLFKK